MIEIRVIELFAGVGGFRVGLNRASDCFKVVWSSQWEPSTKVQHASQIYEARFGKAGHSNEDIERVIEEKFLEIPNHDLLVGGFPCQDYSVARTLIQAEGIVGKKGVLWWSIYNILKKKGINAPSYLMLENVDRLLKSPASQRGRDFAIMLSSLSELGYAVEWRVINAADYGLPQRRRRVFILAYRKGTNLHLQLKSQFRPEEWIKESGVIAKAFPVMRDTSTSKKLILKDDAPEITKSFSINSPSASPFENAGIMIDNEVFTFKVTPEHKGNITTLRQVLISDDLVPEEFFIKEKDLEKWKYLKGAKSEPRASKNGHVYNYTEGPMVFPDALDKPSRTIITGEGGSTPSRFKHVVTTSDGRLRRLTPIELERLNMFDNNHTLIPGITDARRAFMMGNALVVGVIERLGKSLASAVGAEPKKGISQKRKPMAKSVLELEHI